MQLLAIVCLVFGESLSILAEIFATKNSNPLIGWRNGLPLITLAGMFLIGGYVLGYQAFKNIWPVVAFSIGTIVVVEPVLVWFILHEIPELGSLVGLIFGLLGICATLFL